MSMRPRNLAIALLLSTGLLTLGCSGSSDSSAPTTRDATTSSTTSTTTSTTTTTTREQPEEAVWPYANTSSRYQDPAAAAKGFAVDYLAFVNPVVGEFQPGDSRSGEVPVRATSQGPVTTVMVRQLGPENTWWVIGASTPNIEIQAPTALSKTASPVTVSGRSTAFEGTINVEIREDGRMDPIAEGTTQGGSMGEMGPFTTSLQLTEGGATAGAVIVKTLSAMDGNVAEASVVRIRFS